MLRLLEYAPLYFDLKAFPDGETKRALVRADAKRRGTYAELAGSRNGSRKGTPSDDHKAKRRKV